MKQKLISLSIALILGAHHAYAAPVTGCPSNIDKLSTAEKNKLPKSCLNTGLTEQQWWMIGGAATAVVAGIAVAASNGGGGGGDDDGGNTPIPPDDGGDTPIPPDDGGDTPIPPDDGGDTPIPPDDGGDTPIPPDDGGDTPIPPDDGGDTPIPPDDGDDVPVSQTTTYPNGLSITMVPGANTATFAFNGQTYNAEKQSDTLWSLTDKDGKVVYVSSLDQVTGALKGFSIVDRKTWQLDGTTPTGVGSWTSDYAVIQEGSLDSNTLLAPDPSRPLVAESTPGSTSYLLGVNLVADDADGNTGGRIQIEQNATFLNSSTLIANINSQGQFNPDNGFTEFVDVIRVNDGTFINGKTGQFYSALGASSIVGLGNAKLYNFGYVGNYTSSIFDGAFQNPSKQYSGTLYLLGGDSADETVTWTNAASGTIEAGSGVTVLSDLYAGAEYEDNLEPGATHDQGNIVATNNGTIYFASTEYTDTTYPNGTSATDAISLGNSANNTSTFTNNGTMTVTGDGATAMKGQNNTTLVNNGTINLGDPDKTIDENGTGLVAFKAYGDNVTAYNQGTININANSSYIFDRNGTQATLVNTGHVEVRDGVTSWAMVKNESSDVVDTTTVYQSTVSNYTIGTTASGQTGTMSISHAQIEDVSVNTGFAAGTDAQTVTLNDVFVGEDIQGAENIQSTSVVWNADAQQDSTGNVDVTMTKNSYAEVASADAGVESVASALDAGYTNNALYTSLNLQTAAEVDNAMRQISGANASTVNKEARILSQRFSMLADNAIVMPNGFGFNLVDKNDTRTELGNNTRYDMAALSQSFNLSANQTLRAQYGIARLDGNGVDGKQKAGDNGLTGGYSQFFGLSHSLDLGDNLSFANTLRYDVQHLESSRSVSYTGVSANAESENNQQYMELRSQFSKGFALSDELNITPLAGLKLRHTSNSGVSERGAGDFNLQLDSQNETAVDALAGVTLKYTGKNGLAFNALLEGGPNLSYEQSNQFGTVSGAGNNRFQVDNGQKGGGMNNTAQIGFSYGGEQSKLAFDAYHWKEDGITDKGMRLNYQYKF